MSLRPEARVMICAAAVLVALGVLMVQSASITSRPTDREEMYLSKHMLQLVVGLIGGMTAALIPPKLWYRSAPIVFVGVATLLMLVLVPGLGTEVNAARRWFRIGPLSLQPSELAKLALPLTTAYLFTARKRLIAKPLRGPVLL